MQFRTLHCLGAFCATLALGGCASVDPQPDIAASATLAGQRLSTTPDWSRPWNAPCSWDGTTPLSVNESVAIALERNLELRTALSDIGIARAELAGAATPPNPMLAFTYGASTEGAGVNLIAASAMQQLQWLWQRPTRVAAAEARLRAAILLAADRALATVASVRIQHARVVAAEARARAHSELCATLANRMTNLIRQEQAGLITSDERRMLSDLVAKAERERLEADATVRTTKIALLTTLALVEREGDWKSDGVWAEATTPGVAMQRLDVAAVAAMLLAADADAERAGLAGLPDLAAGIAFDRGTDGMPTLGPSLTFSLPVIDRGDPAKAAAAAVREKALLALDIARQRAIAEVNASRSTFESALAQWQGSAETRRVIAQERDALAARAFTAGTIDINVRSLVRSDLAEREVDAINDRLAAIEASIALDRAMGGVISRSVTTMAKGGSR